MNEAFRKILYTKEIQKADRVLVTGDITDRGDFDSWKIFWSAVSDAGLKEKIIALPGNHDVCCLGARMPGRGYKEEDLQKAIDGLTFCEQPTRFPWVIQPDKRVAIFGLNSNNLGNLTGASNARGRIGYYQLVALAGKLRTFRDVPVKIVALHHSPNIPGKETAIKRKQRPLTTVERLTHQIPQDQRKELMLLCITHGVRLLLHGHLHTFEDRRVSGIRIVGAPATTQPLFANNKKLAYNFYSYKVNGDGRRVNCTKCAVIL